MEISLEDKEAIEYIKAFQKDLYGASEKNLMAIYIDRIWNYIEKLQKVIDLMAEELKEITGSCPLDSYDWENEKCDNCNNTFKECFIEYFYKKVEEEDN